MKQHEPTTEAIVAAFKVYPLPPTSVLRPMLRAAFQAQHLAQTADGGIASERQSETANRSAVGADAPPSASSVGRKVPSATDLPDAKGEHGPS